MYYLTEGCGQYCVIKSPKINLLPTITYIYHVPVTWGPAHEHLLAFGLLYSSMLCGLVLIVIN